MEGLLGPTGARLEKIVETQRRNDMLMTRGFSYFFLIKTILVLCLSCVTTGLKNFLAANCFLFAEKLSRWSASLHLKSCFLVQLVSLFDSHSPTPFLCLMTCMNNHYHHVFE